MLRYRTRFVLPLAAALIVASCGDNQPVAPGFPGADGTGPLELSERVESDRVAARIVRGGSYADYPIENRYIVRLSDGTSDVGHVAESLLRDIEGAKLHYVYERTIQGFSATLPSHAVEEVRAGPSVRHVHSVRVYEREGSWGRVRVNQRELSLPDTYDPVYTGSGVEVYVIDTGIRAAHTAFGGRARTTQGGFDAFRDPSHPFYAEDCYYNGLTDVEPVEPSEGGFHGTHVAGTIGGASFGVAPGVPDLFSVNVFDFCGGSPSDAIIAGVEWVTMTATLPAVANMSLSGDTTLSGNQDMEDAITASIQTGIAYVAAAGNQALDACSRSPARMSGVITVAASDSTDAFATTFPDDPGAGSNYGACVDIIAPGVSILSAAAHNNGDTTCVSCTIAWGGTSMATPHVAGLAALVLSEYPGLTPAQVKDTVLVRATPNAISDVPTGTPNLLAFTPRVLTGSIDGTAVVYDTASAPYVWEADVTGGDGAFGYEWARRWNYPTYVGPWVVVSADDYYDE